MRIWQVLVLLGIGGFIAILVLVGAGVFAIREFEVFGYKTPKIDQASMKKFGNAAVDASRGYTAAKNPKEAMETFRAAIQKRHYRGASRYCTSEYAKMLEDAHDKAVELGGHLEEIYDYAKAGGIRTGQLDTPRVRYTLQCLDPFPKYFIIAKDPEVSQDDSNRAFGTFTLNQQEDSKDVALVVGDQMFKSLDPLMFNKILTWGIPFDKPIEIIKESDEWKLKVPVTAKWKSDLTYYLNRCDTYSKGLVEFKKKMNEHLWQSPSTFDAALLQELNGLRGKKL